MPFTCPVCGYPGLYDPPRSPSGNGSYEICPSCGFGFGVSDDDKGETYETWRARWVKEGSHWQSKGRPQPPDWNPDAQLRGGERGQTAAEYLGVTARALQSLRYRQLGPAYYRIGSGPKARIAYRYEDLRAWHASRIRRVEPARLTANKDAAR